MVLRYCFHILLFLNYLYNFRHKNDSRPAKIKNIEKKLSNYVNKFVRNKIPQYQTNS